MNALPQSESFAIMRAYARQIFDHAMREASVAKAFAKHVDYSRGVLRVGDDLYPLDRYRRVLAIAMGKAAHSMSALLAARTGTVIGGIVAGVEDSGHNSEHTMLPGFRYYAGGHPLPTAGSVTAAEAILKSLHALGSDALVVYLISGGASASIEKPVDPEISLPDLIATYRVLLHSGAPIAEINAIRKHLSAIKGGRMAAAAGGAHQVSILVSDVPVHAGSQLPDALASGPSTPDATTVEECHHIAREYGMDDLFPASVRELFQRHALEETPKKDDSAFRYSRWWTILSSADNEQGAAAEAARLGGKVVVDNTCDDWAYQAAADYLLQRLRELSREQIPVCLISAGEVTVQVSGDPGTGGRNQQFALYAASKIDGENICVLSAGSDGIDGNSPAAGAIVDGETLQRAQHHSLDIAGALASFNTYPIFEQLGDAITTGPTGNNVRDLRILLAGF